MNPRLLTTLLALFGLAFFAQSSVAQEATSDLTLKVEPASITLQVGERTTVTTQVLDAEGKVVEGMQVFLVGRGGQGLRVDRRKGELQATTHGEYTLLAVAFGAAGRVQTEVAVTVPAPPIESVTFAALPAQVYQHTQVPLQLAVRDVAGQLRDDVAVQITSSAPEVATVDPFQTLIGHETGRVTLTAVVEGKRATAQVAVVPNPIVRLEMGAAPSVARTGDVIDFDVTAYDAAGEIVAEVPVFYSFQAQPDDVRGPAATGQIMQDGRFVAEAPGLYTVVASTGNQAAQHRLRINTRNVSQEIELLGQQSVGVYTSDIWVWEGVDGRDYAMTGTWGANGEAYFWDVTDPTNMVMIDTVTVDARTVNDVKVTEAGDVCIISREGASNRRNGLVLLDCTNPADVKILAEYDENLTGGVHNVYPYQGHVFALSGGQRYDIINIEDPRNPYRVGSFELETPGHSIHDVWVEDGIAYSSNWRDGVVMVDVGNGIKGGSLSNPVFIGSYAYPSGWNHAAFPYKSKDTGKFYVIAGDEHFLPPNRTPTGWIHIIDFTDPDNPQEVARYEVPEAGTHNFWVEDDKLYVAYYQGGLRVVDLSGDLLGDLYKQGREIAKYVTEAADGFLPNKARAWGTMTHKGNIFLSDKHSGIWSLRLKPKQGTQPEM